MSSSNPLQDYRLFLATTAQISKSNSEDFQSMFFLTDLGTHIHWFCSRSVWRSCLNSLSLVHDNLQQERTLRNFTANLFGRVNNLDYNLFKNMLLSPGERYMSRAAFAGDEVQTGIGASAWYHGIQQAVLLDRLLWVDAVYKSGMDDRPAQKPHGNLPGAVALQDVQKLRTSYLSWDATIAAFLSQWNSQRSENLPSDTPPITQGDEIIASLFLAARTAEVNRHLATVESNFCWAAIALRLLCLNAVQTIEKSDANTLSVYLSDLVQSGDVKKLSDFDILKPLYSAVTFSPMVLLGRSLCTHSGARRVSLSSMSQHCLLLPQLTNDPLRAGVEYDIWKLIIDMALHGHAIYRMRMSACVSSWQTLGLGSPCSPTQPYFPQQYDINEWARNWRHVNAAGSLLDELSKELKAFTSRSSYSQSSQSFTIDPNISWPLQVARRILDKQGNEPPTTRSSTHLPSPPPNTVQRQGQQSCTEPNRFPGAWSPAPAAFSGPRARAGLNDQDTVHTSISAVPNPHRADPSTGVSGIGTALDLQMSTAVERSGPPAVAHDRDMQVPAGPVASADQHHNNNTDTILSFNGRNANNLQRGAILTTTTNNNGNENSLGQLELGEQGTLRRSKRKQAPKSPTVIISSSSSRPAKRRRRKSRSIKTEAKQVRFAQQAESESEPSPVSEQGDEALMKTSDGGEENIKEVYHLRFLSQPDGAIEPVRTLDMSLSCPIVKPGLDEDVLEWTTENFSAVEWKGLEADFKLLCDMLTRVADAETNRKLASSDIGVLSIPRRTWNRFSAKERQTLLRTSNIHVVAHRLCPLREGNDTCSNFSSDGVHKCPLADINVPPILDGVTDWDSESLSLWLDLDDLRPVHDLTSSVTPDNPNVRIHKASLEEFLEERQKRRHILNILTIGLSGQQVCMPVGGLDDLSKFFSRDDPMFTFKTPWNRDPYAWALAAHGSAISTTHMDPAGFSTHIRIILGIKIWFFATNAKLQLPSMNGFVGTDYIWDAVVLRPNDDFYMLPGVPHFVISLRDCLAVGGHFFSSVLFSNSLRAIVIEHYFGKDVTNTEHLTSGLAFFKAVAGYLSLCKLPELHVRRRNSFPEWDQLASLIVLVMHFDQLDPLLPEPGDDLINPSEPWQFSEEFEHDHGIAYQLAIQLGTEVYCDDFCSALDRVEAEFSSLTAECEQISDNTDRAIELVAVKDTIEFHHSN